MNKYVYIYRRNNITGVFMRVLDVFKTDVKRIQSAPELWNFSIYAYSCVPKTYRNNLNPQTIVTILKYSLKSYVWIRLLRSVARTVIVHIVVGRGWAFDVEVIRGPKILYDLSRKLKVLLKIKRFLEWTFIIVFIYFWKLFKLKYPIKCKIRLASTLWGVGRYARNFI